MTDSSGQTLYNYDNMGRIANTTKTIGTTSYPLTFSYSNGRLNSITYPDNETVSYGYYPEGNLKNVGSYVLSYSNYDALGRPGSIVYGNQASTVLNYDPISRRLDELSVLSPTQSLPLIDNTYGYDNKGNITGINDLMNKPQATNFYSETYTPVRAHALDHTGSGRTFHYDGNGNITNDGTRDIIYNYDNMPTTVGNVSFTYDGNGSRVIKDSPGATILYVDKLYECTNGHCVNYIFASNQRIALKSSIQTLYYHPDHQGSTSVVTDANGNNYEEVSYFPFGQTRQKSGLATVSHMFTGQELDHETNLYNYNARLYDPDLGRYLTPDSIVPDPSNPQSLNRYSYAQNNPTNLTDPSGRCPICFIAVGAIIGAVSSGIQNDWNLEATLMGAGIGAASGAVFNVAGTYATSQITSLTGSIAAGEIGGAVVGGAAAGVTSAAISGADPGMGALTGGAFGVVSLFGTPNFSPFGNSAAGSIGNRLFNSALTGAGFGAAYAGVTGGNISQGAMWGAASWAGGEAANMAIGHAYGFIASGGNGPTFSEGVFVYDANTLGWTTFGNVITGPASSLDNALTRAGSTVSGVTWRNHEMGHMLQSTLLGPAYIPAQAASLTVGAAIGLVSGQGAIYGSHAYGLLERYYHPVPQW